MKSESSGQFRRSACAALLVVQPLVVSSAWALDLQYQTIAGLGYSDNIARTADDEQNETIASAELQFSLAQRTAKVTADVIGDLAYQEYLDNTYDSEFVGNFAADARYAFVPERFDWVLSDNFGQVLSDPFQASTPDNRENINYFSTGPDVTLGLGSQMRVRIGGRYSMTDYADSPLDSHSGAVQLGLIRDLSAATSLSLNARSQKIKYEEDALNGDYDQDDAYLRYEAEGARTVVGIDAGYSRIDRDASSDTEDGLLLRLDASRRISAASRVSITAGREFASSGSAFAQSQSVGGVGLSSAPGRQTAQPFTNDYATLDWAYTRHRTTLTIFGSWNDRSYDEASILDQALLTYGARLRRTMSAATSMNLEAARTSADFKQPGGDYDENLGSISFSWRATASITLRLSYNYIDRSADRTTGEYTENRVWLSVAYGRGDPRATPAPHMFAVDAASAGANL